VNVKVNLKEDFKYAIGGLHVTVFKKGVQEVPEEVADWAVENKKGSRVTKAQMAALEKKAEEERAKAEKAQREADEKAQREADERAEREQKEAEEAEEKAAAEKKEAEEKEAKERAAAKDNNSGDNPSQKVERT
jgi:hypothetical protein